MARLTSVHVSTQRAWHGGEEQAALLVRGLEQRGHRAVIFARRGGEFATRMEQQGHEVRAFAGRGRSPQALWSMRRWLKELRPDVVHVHDSHALGSCALAAIGLTIPARVAARKVVYPLRSGWCYRHFANRVIAVSAAVAQVCRQGGIPAERIRVVYDGVDPARIAQGDRQRGRASISAQSNEIILLTVASLTEPKGHCTLLAALPQVLAKYPQVRLVWAGDGPLRDDLSALAKSLGVAAKVTMLGHRHDVPDLLKAADLLLAPSHAEGLCSTLIDAMLAGTPIVTTTAGGIPELVGASEAESPVALLCKPADDHSLAAALLQALASADPMQALARRAYARASTQFTADNMVEQTLAVYEELLGNRQQVVPRPTTQHFEPPTASANRRSA